MSRKGFTLLELLVVLAIMGIAVLGSFPSIMNTMEVRALDTEARDIMSTFQTARWQAVDTKLNHRVRFTNADGVWAYGLERETAPGTWTALRSKPFHHISSKFTATVTLPASLAVVFTSTGFVTGYSNTNNRITLDSAKLKKLSQPDRRLIQFFASGSVLYQKITT